MNIKKNIIAKYRKKINLVNKYNIMKKTKDILSNLIPMVVDTKLSQFQKYAYIF